jgi:hypothetical protein
MPLELCPTRITSWSSSNAARAVPDENHVVEFLERQDVGDVLDVGSHTDIGEGEIGAFAETGQRWCVHGTSTMVGAWTSAMASSRAGVVGRGTTGFVVAVRAASDTLFECRRFIV